MGRLGRTAPTAEDEPCQQRELTPDMFMAELAERAAAPKPAEPKAKPAKRPSKDVLPARDDLEGWRARLKASPKHKKREVVIAWAALFGATTNGYGEVVLPAGLPPGPVTDALRSAVVFYWRPEGHG